MSYDLKIEKNPGCKRISQYILNFCFYFDEYDSVKCDKYQKMFEYKCSKSQIQKDIINTLFNGLLEIY